MSHADTESLKMTFVPLLLLFYHHYKTSVIMFYCDIL